MLDENAVIAAVEEFLAAEFDTSSVPAGTRGIDIEGTACDGIRRWYIEAKGATSSRLGSPRHGIEYGNGVAFDRVAKALLSACDLRLRYGAVTDFVGIAIPSNRWFDEHSAKIEHACELLRITIFRVRPDRTIVLAGHIPHTGS